MRKYLLPIAAVALLATIGSASAQGLGRPAVSYSVGTIKTVDAAKSSVTLDDGNTYVLPATIKAGDLKVGQQVNVTFTSSNGKRVVSELNAIQ